MSWSSWFSFFENISSLWVITLSEVHTESLSDKHKQVMFTCGGVFFGPWNKPYHKISHKTERVKCQAVTCTMTISDNVNMTLLFHWI